MNRRQLLKLFAVAAAAAGMPAPAPSAPVDPVADVDVAEFAQWWATMKVEFSPFVPADTVYCLRKGLDGQGPPVFIMSRQMYARVERALAEP